MRIAVAILVTFVACKNHDVERMESVMREVCACKDASCADRAMAPLEKDHIARSAKTQEVARAMLDCRAKLEDAEQPSTDPDAEGSGSGSAAPPATGSAAPARP